MHIETRESNNVIHIQLGGACNIDGSEELQKLLIENLSKDCDLVVEFSDTIELDLTIAQLLIAARKECASKKKKFHVTGMIGSDTGNLLRRAGLLFEFNELKIEE